MCCSTAIESAVRHQHSLRNKIAAIQIKIDQDAPHKSNVRAVLVLSSIYSVERRQLSVRANPQKLYVTHRDCRVASASVPRASDLPPPHLHVEVCPCCSVAAGQRATRSRRYFEPKSPRNTCDTPHTPHPTGSRSSMPTSRRQDGLCQQVRCTCFCQLRRGHFKRLSGSPAGAPRQCRFSLNDSPLAPHINTCK